MCPFKFYCSIGYQDILAMNMKYMEKDVLF
jgi:hypothetical protein